MVALATKLAKKEEIYSLSDRTDYTFRRLCVRLPLAAAGLVICSPHYSTMHVELRGSALCRVGVPASQLDLPSLTPLSVAGCSRLQRGARHWATSIALLQVVDN